MLCTVTVAKNGLQYSIYTVHDVMEITNGELYQNKLKASNTLLNSTFYTLSKER
jgi:hypothetical protein